MNMDYIAHPAYQRLMNASITNVEKHAHEIRHNESVVLSNYY